MTTDVIFDGGTPSGPVVSTIQTAIDECSDIFALVKRQLQDLTGKIWDTTATMIPYFNLAIKEIVNTKPEAFTQIFTFPLAAGPRQSLPPGALFLVDVESILDVAGNPVSGVVLISKEVLDRLLPGWYSFVDTDDTVKYVIRDERNPLKFYAFPPPPGSTVQSAALVCACYPAEITADTDDFPLDNSYVPAAVDFITSMCLGEETTIPGAQAKAQMLTQRFYQKLGVKTQVKSKSDSEGA